MYTLINICIYLFNIYVHNCLYKTYLLLHYFSIGLWRKYQKYLQIQLKNISVIILIFQWYYFFWIYYSFLLHWDQQEIRQFHLPFPFPHSALFWLVGVLCFVANGKIISWAVCLIASFLYLGCSCCCCLCCLTSHSAQPAGRPASPPL